MSCKASQVKEHQEGGEGIRTESLMQQGPSGERQISPEDMKQHGLGGSEGTQAEKVIRMETTMAFHTALQPQEQS